MGLLFVSPQIKDPFLVIANWSGNVFKAGNEARDTTWVDIFAHDGGISILAAAGQLSAGTWRSDGRLCA